LIVFEILLIPRISISQSGIPVGVILEITGPAYLKPAEDMAQLQLDPKRDVMRILCAGQSLKAGLGGQLKLGFSTGIKEILPSESWFVIKQEVSLTPEQKKVAQALRNYGTAGGTRSIGSILLSPVEGSSVRAKDMEIRWNPKEKEKVFEIRIETKSERQLWSIKEVKSTVAKVGSGDLNKTLANYQAAGGQEGLVLVVTDAESNETRVSFFLLPKEREQELQVELDRWEKTSDPLLRAIGRAYEYGHYGLLIESAEEYDAALALAPESRDLIVSAIEAYNRTGNYVRVAELQKRLDQLY
jgi:hypothetical protein